MVWNQAKIKRAASHEARNSNHRWNPWKHVTWNDPPREYDPESGGTNELAQVQTAPEGSTGAEFHYLSEPAPSEQSISPIVSAAAQGPSSIRSRPAGRRPTEDSYSTGVTHPARIDEDGEKEERKERKPGIFKKCTPSEPITIRNQIQRTLFGSWINILLVAAPVGIVLGQIDSVSRIVVFIVNFIAIVPLAALLGFATEEIALRTGETLGGLMNATFGNAVELIVAIVALTKGRVTIVQTSLIGSILSNLKAVASLSRGTSVILLVVYGGYLFFQLKTHSAIFLAESEKVTTKPFRTKTPEKGIAGGPVGGAMMAAAHNNPSDREQLSKMLMSPHALEEEDEEEEPQLHFAVAVATLTISTVIIAFCAEFMVSGIDAVTEGTGVGKAFVGLILLPIVGNAAEHATAIMVTMKDKMDKMGLAIGVALGGLINATFGNAVELIVAIVALTGGQVTIVQMSLIGFILSNLLLVLGMYFLCGGINPPREHDPKSSPTKENPRKVSDFSSGLKQYFVEGDVNGTPVEALPDSGAAMCFISPKLASGLGLGPAPGTQQRIYLANKRSVQSPGMVEVPWRFAGEQKTHILDCWILPGCVDDLILGNHFLRETQALTKFIKSKLVKLPKRLRLSLLGDEKQRLWGYLDCHLTAALPDTGSDVMLISSAYARRIGLTIDRDSENWLELEFADGTTAWTSGVVRDVPWSVGGKAVRCDFQALDDLCVDVILSKNYLFDLSVFSEHKDCFFDIDSEEDLFQLCNIRLIGRYGDTLDVLEEEYLEDVTSPNAFSPEMVQRELARRDQIRDEILTLPENQREAAIQAEAERQRRWQDLRQAHRTRWETESSEPQSSNGRGRTHRTQIRRDLTRASEGPPTGEVAEDGLHGVGARRAWWKKKIRISIPLRSLRRSTGT